MSARRGQVETRRQKISYAVSITPRIACTLNPTISTHTSFSGHDQSIPLYRHTCILIIILGGTLRRTLTRLFVYREPFRSFIVFFFFKFFASVVFVHCRSYESSSWTSRNRRSQINYLLHWHRYCIFIPNKHIHPNQTNIHLN